MLDPENFDHWIFNTDLTEQRRQEYLDQILKTRVEDAAREHHLTAPQRAKLRLAGSGDIKRFFDEVEGKRSEFNKGRLTYKSGRAELLRLVPLAQVYQEGPFGDGSLFAKTLHKINDDRQAGH